MRSTCLQGGVYYEPRSGRPFRFLDTEPEQGAHVTPKTDITERAVEVDRDALMEVARRSLSAKPRSFLRWAGSKRALLPQIVEALPANFGVYREPFLGSGALFFLLRPERAALSDACSDLVQAFEAVRDDVGAVLRYLEPLKPDKETFYSVRGNRSRGRIRHAAEFIYLNKTCWNGLYRVNSDGEFNVPYGAPKTEFIADPANLRACSKALRAPGVSLNTSHFTDALADVSPGDLVFLDPPYVTGHNNNGFIDYNEKLFSWADQERAAECAIKAAQAGAHVIVTNAFHQAVLDLYPGFEMRPLVRHSTLASSASARREVTEAVLWHPGS